ncbi:hydantoinase/oxoprolinase family protein [Fuchsiella alkaliacetigena]|uniref:hydantoinase/oxoprolinase family protein n=1 Tax=Fuchsiella alkaliacetigena TaxID=957042 RepID=UPI00200A9279|nr:hydantoinase/oxoprolinase family protein [Fuchsiella alkaliacetigena]MCK8824777.1 hydantoinase/oxoprolinase family protein [Fuchsiella alkaliacetigena]
MKLGIDIGGTNTDGVLIKNEEVLASTKLSTEADSLAATILKVCRELISSKKTNQISQVNLSTTLTTNQIAQENFPPVGLLIIPGPGLNPDWYHYSPATEVLSGSIDHRGREVAPLNLNEVKAALKKFTQEEISRVAICAKFSPRNPKHEIKIKKLIKDEFPEFDLLTLGHQLSGKLNFPRRTATTYLNTAVLETQQQFIAAIKEGLADLGIQAPVQVLKADGGTMSLTESLQAPIESINSGPAASIMGVLATSDLKGTTLALDIGGTTTDISLFIDEKPLFKPQGVEINNYKTLVRGLYNESLACGGDSLVQIVDQQLQIAPQRRGNAAAYGGVDPTPTDALVVLGLDQQGQLAAAKNSLEPLAKQLGLTVKKVALKIVELFCTKIEEKVTEILNKLNNQPVYTINELLSISKIKPNSLVGIGGPAAALIPTLAKKLKLDYLIPNYSPIVNAIGAALARSTKKCTLYADTAQGYYQLPELGITEKIEQLDLATAKKILQESLAEQLPNSKTEIEITSAQSFNMVRGFNTIGQIIEATAQIKPGLTNKLRRGHL